MDTFFVVDFRCNGLVDGHCSEVHWISTLSARETQRETLLNECVFIGSAPCLLGKHNYQVELREGT